MIRTHDLSVFRMAGWRSSCCAKQSLAFQTNGSCRVLGTRQRSAPRFKVFIRLRARPCRHRKRPAHVVGLERARKSGQRVNAEFSTSGSDRHPRQGCDGLLRRIRPLLRRRCHEHDAGLMRSSASSVEHFWIRNKPIFQSESRSHEIFLFESRPWQQHHSEFVILLVKMFSVPI